MHPPTTLPLRQKLSSHNLHDPPTPTTPHGFRAQINQLIPKHSYFRARVVVHQIDSVPFVSGLFSVRWRFKHVHSPPTQRQGLLGIVKTRSKNGDRRLPHHHSGDDPDNNNPSPPIDPSLPSLLISSDASSTTTASSARVPSFASTSTSSSGSSGAISALAGAVYSITARSTHPDSITLSNYASASRSTLHLPSSTSPTPTTTSFPSTVADASQQTPALPSSFTPPRGNTPYLDLKDHSVRWNQTLSTVIRLDVDRDTGSILPCPFKLVVMQRVRDNDPEIHRLGALYLNLSEYVGHGPVERRYLLRESKTNATLKLTIELEYISGETHYIPPPLPKGEILNGLSGYLEGELRTVTRGQTVDIYGPYRDQDELELDLFGTQYHTNLKSTTTTTTTTTTTSTRIRYPVDDDDSGVDISLEDHDNSGHAEHEAPPLPLPLEPAAFDVERLPIAYGTKTTETLIEAIFNPVRTSERRCESPFTIYVPPPPPPPLPSPQPQIPKSGGGAARVERATAAAVVGATTRAGATATSEVESVYSTESSSASSGSGSGSGSAAGSTRAMSQSGRSRDSHSQYSHHSSSDTRSLRSTNGGGGGGGGAGGRVKDWWRKIGSSRPQTPVGR